MKYIVDRSYAKELLEWAYEQNPGPWFEHSINVAQATENIIIELIKNGYNLDADIAYNAALCMISEDTKVLPNRSFIPTMVICI